MSAATQKGEPDRPSGPRTHLCKQGRRKVLRSAVSLGLIGLAFTAQIGSARAEGSLVDLFSQLFAPGPQPSYAPSVPASQPLHAARRRRTELVPGPHRGAIVRARHSERVRAARSPDTVPIRVSQASLPAPAMEKAGASREKDLASLPSAGQHKVQGTRPTRTVKQEPSGDPVAQVLNDPTLRRGDIVVLPGGAKVFNGRANTSDQLSDFEDVRSSKLLSESTRRAVIAMSVQAPAAPTPAPTAMASVGQVQSGEDQRAAVTGSVRLE